MANPTRQQVAEQINQLQSQGASEEQIAAAVTKSGYQLDDFVVSLDGKFEPFVIKSATGVPSSTPQELGQTQQQYDESLAASVSAANKPTNRVTTTTTTVTETTQFEQSTGGGTTTRYSTPSTPTPESQTYKTQADQAYNLAEAYRINPNTALGKASLDRRLADGTITKAQYDEISNSTREERLKKSGEYSAQYEQAREKEINSLGPGISTAEVTPSYDTSQVTTTAERITTTETTVLKGDVPGSNVKTETVDGVTYQVVSNGDGTSSYTVQNDPTGGSTSVTVTDPITPDNIEPEPVDAAYNDSGELVDLNTGQVYNVDPESGFVENSTGLLISPEDIEADYNERGELVDLNTGQVYNIDEESGFIETEGGFLVSPEDIANEPGYGDEDTEEPLTEFTAGPDAPYAQGSSKGLPGATQNAQAQATLQDTANFQAKADWRVRLSLAPGATYLYKASPVAGILQPLQATDGVIFPYTPTVSVQYSASYDPTNLVHSNYKVYQYSGSSVDSVNITCDFTAQDTQEANYLLAVIHFFRSVTKMFYGQDDGPKPGTPPPLCYLSGLGAYQFDAHPLAITGFTYSLPNDVDYIRADIVTGASLPGVNTSAANTPNNTASVSNQRLTQGGSNISVGGGPAPTQFPSVSNAVGSKEPTYVPTKIQLSIAAIPMMSRNQMSNDFSLKEYAKGTLLRGSKRSKPGVW